MGDVVSASAFSRSFNGKNILHEVAMQVAEHERVAIVGANGSGKTTLLRILATLITPTTGEVRVFGHSVLRESRAIREIVGWAPAVDNGFFPRLTGFENLRLFGALRRLDTKALQLALGPWRQIEVFCEALNTPFYLCSAGMKQLLTLSRAFVANPRLAILDEPTRSLDATTAVECLDLLDSICKEKTVIISSHHERDVKAIGARALTLRGGCLA